MSTKDDVITALQNFISERENKNHNSIRLDEIEIQLSLTQFHILNILHKENDVNNKTLTSLLNISKPAVTKSIKKLLTKGFIKSYRHQDNKKEIYYSLTNLGEKYAIIHDSLHQQAYYQYSQILNDFSSDELTVIVKFLNKLTMHIKE